jgi:hypothetical protein
MKQMKVPVGLEKLVCNNNELIKLEFPYHSNLLYVKCSDNHLMYFNHIPEKITDMRNFLCHKNPFFFNKSQTILHSRPIFSLQYLRNMCYLRNKAHIIKEIIQDPHKYRHMIHWGTLYERIKNQRNEWSQMIDQPHDCPICLEKIIKENVCLSECLHIFCYHCVNKLHYTTNCPMCRNNLIWKHKPQLDKKEKRIMECINLQESKGIVFNYRRAFETIPL